MDKETKKLIEEASDRAADKAADKLKPLVREAAQQAGEESRHHFDAVAEQLTTEIRAIGEGQNLNAERLDGHEKRITKLEGMPLPQPES